MSDSARLERRAKRERAARKSAEALLEEKSRELFAANQSLEKTKADLELIVEERTADLTLRAGFTQILFRATENTSKPIGQQLDEALALATDALQLSRGVLSHVVGEQYFVERVYTAPSASDYSVLKPSATKSFDLAKTFSRFALESADVFAIEHISQSQWATISGLVGEQTEAFVGSPIVVNGELYGTLAFVSKTPATITLGAAVKDFVQFLARWVGSAIERQLAEKSVQAQRDELRKLSHVASRTHNMVIITDAYGKIEWVNQSFERLTGYTEAEAMGKKPGALLQGEGTDQETVAYMRERLLRQQEFHCEVLNYSKSGVPYWTEIEVQPVRNDDGQLAHFIAVENDITERREFETSLRQAKQAAEEANVAKSQFLANMSHEIRTPMNAIIGMAGLLMDTPLSAEQVEFSSTIRVAGDNLLTIVNEILDFSKIEAGKMELSPVPFVVRSCVEEALDLVASSASEKQIDLAYYIDPDTPVNLVGDVSRLRQVIVNLASNAIKFTEEGEVVVNIRSETVTDDRCRLHFSVHDTGIGIPTDRVGHLFQPFMQVDASTTRLYGGTGLGLVICKRICELMNGDISVESEEGVGSIFSFHIEATLGDPPEYDIQPTNLQLENKRVLIVDDNATNRLILCRYAEAWGMICIQADSAAAALKILNKDTKFDVAVLDVQMPEMDGYELASLMKNRPAIASIPLVILSSNGRPDAIIDQLDIVAYLNKPLKPKQLLDVFATIFTGTAHRQNVKAKTISEEYEHDFAERYPLQILLAEDNRVNQMVATRMLGRLGYRVDVAGNGLEALAALERQDYDVVLMDVQMPEMDGVEATKQINQRFSAEKRPHIIALTANALQGDREAYLAAGMDDYASKPIRVNELTDALKRVPRNASEQPDPLESADDKIAYIDLAFVTEQFGEDMGQMMEMLVPLFVEDTNGQLALIEQALQTNESETIRKQAHTIKGSASSLGISKLSEAAHALEAACKLEPVPDLTLLSAELQHTYQLLLADATFKQWLG